MDITTFLRLMVEKGASDLFFSVGASPQIKVEGVISPVGEAILKAEQTTEMACLIMNEDQRKEFQATMELNMGLSINELGRFRINIFRQRGDVSIVVRYIKNKIPSIEQLNLPLNLKTIVMELRGLVLVVGATGSGKSTTLASMIDYRNENHGGHILTIEDPIEFIHPHKKSIVDQREVGIDTLSYDNALVNAMREAPDVILIGEIRERNSMRHAIDYAQTGHLCISTLHANNANQALERIINFFPEEARKQILMDVSLNLRAIISLRLVPGVNNQRMAAVELLLNTPYVADLIEKGRIDDIKEVMERNKEHGMQTFDQSLLSLYEEGFITEENAIKYADSKNNVGLQIRLNRDATRDPPNDRLSISDSD